MLVHLFLHAVHTIVETFEVFLQAVAGLLLFIAGSSIGPVAVEQESGISSPLRLLLSALLEFFGVDDFPISFWATVERPNRFHYGLL